MNGPANRRAIDIGGSVACARLVVNRRAIDVAGPVAYIGAIVGCGAMVIAGPVACIGAIVDRGAMVIAGSVTHIGAIVGRRVMNIAGLIAYVRAILLRRCLVVSGLMRCRFAQDRVRVLVNRCVHAARRTHVGVVAGGMVGRGRCAVDVGRVMPVATVPGGRTPIRHKA